MPTLCSTRCSEPTAAPDGTLYVCCDCGRATPAAPCPYDATTSDMNTED